MKRLLVPVLALASIAAHAQVRYTFQAQDDDRSFTLTSPTFVNPTDDVASTFLIHQLDAVSCQTPFRYVELQRYSRTLDRISFGQDDVDGGGTAFSYYFDRGSFGTFGTHTATLTGEGPSPNMGTLTVAPVPEPASMAALGLGAVAMIRRRKKA